MSWRNCPLPIPQIPNKLNLESLRTYWLFDTDWVGATEDRDDMDEDEDETKEKDDGDALLRDFQYQIKCQYMEKGRNLRAACSH